MKVRPWPIKWSAVSSQQWLCRYCYMDAPYGCWLNGWRKSLMAITQECCKATILNKSWRQHPTKQQLYGYLPHITKTIKIRQTSHTGHCWRSRDELVNDALLWTPSHRRAKAGRQVRTYIQQLCANTGCSPEDLPKVMDNREVWRETVRNIHADSTTWWWCNMKF